MEIITGDFKFDSVVAGQKIFTRYFAPVGEIAGVLQIVHGMAEHSALYGELGEHLAKEGYFVIADDHLGHGRSVSNGEDFGHFFEGGIENVILDEKKLHDAVREKYPQTPYFIMGHSMGSFITREYIARYGEDLSGAIIMGTAAGMKPYKWQAQKALLSILIARNGPKCRMKKIADMSTAGYVKKFPQGPNHWVTSDLAEIDKYTKDPMCGFGLTLSSYKSIGELINTINSKEWYSRVPKDLPILIMSGALDPVGDMGAGVRKVAANLVKTEHDVELNLYPEVRHALVTEVNKPTVFKDIESFLEYKTIRANKLKK